MRVQYFRTLSSAQGTVPLLLNSDMVVVGTQRGPALVCFRSSTTQPMPTPFLQASTMNDDGGGDDILLLPLVSYKDFYGHLRLLE